jgi:cytochrome c oxidase cbb3-type subunit 3
VRLRLALHGLLLLAAPLIAAPAPVPQAAHEQGRAIYNFRCYYCHGYRGDAATLAATFLDPPPRDFRASDPAALTREAMLAVVTHGRPGTAMQPFTAWLAGEEIALVVDFVRREFMLERRDNTRYHTAANGWPDHERYAAAFPFATGALALDTPWPALAPAQAAGKRLFLAACITCHDRARVNDPGPAWASRPLSYPRGGYSHQPAERVDATSGASPYAIHDTPPPLPPGADASVQRGAVLFQANCAFCHAADGTGQNWIGRFMEPPARDLTDATALAGFDLVKLRERIRLGLPGTSMPAWGHVLGEDEIHAVARYVLAVLQRRQ